jgi:hypothetical protein
VLRADIAFVFSRYESCVATSHVLSGISPNLSEWKKSKKYNSFSWIYRLKVFADVRLQPAFPVGYCGVR